MQLYCFGESGNAYKCALALVMADLDWTPVHVDFFNGQACSAEFRKINEMGEVTVLIEGDSTLAQPAVIDYVGGDLGSAIDAMLDVVLRGLAG